MSPGCGRNSTEHCAYPTPGAGKTGHTIVTRLGLLMRLAEVHSEGNVMGVVRSATSSILVQTQAGSGQLVREEFRREGERFM